MEEKIIKVLEEKVKPILASHMGGIVLTRFENDIAFVRLTGSCGSCPSSQFTIEEVVKTIVLEELPTLKDVQLDTSVSSELLEKAREILNKEK